MTKLKKLPIGIQSFEIDDLKPEALLFQTGYLTIKDIEEQLYTLDYPNGEVKSAFLEVLLHSLAKTPGRESSRFQKLSQYLKNEDLESFFNTVSAIFASIPHTLETRRDESYFHTLFYLMVSASGADTRSEVLTCRGCIDLVVELSDEVYIIEFKCDQNVRKGIEQIREKGYADPYEDKGKKVILLAVDFSSENRNLAEWQSLSLSEL